MNAVHIRSTLAVFCLFLIPLTQGCSGEDPDLSPPPAPTAEKPTAPIEKAQQQVKELAEDQAPAEPLPFSTASGETKSARDPFRSFFTDLLKGTDVTAASGPQPPLQRYDVDQFVVRGIIYGIAIPTALVQDPSKDTHTIKIGTIIGRNWGKVVKILKDRVIVNEEFTDAATGKQKVVSVELPLIINKINLGSQTPPMAGEGASMDTSQAAASASEQDRLERFQNIIQSTQTLHQMWTPKRESGGAGAPAATQSPMPMSPTP